MIPRRRESPRQVRWHPPVPGAAYVLLALALLLSLTAPRFLTVGNLTNLGRNAEALGHDDPRCSINRLDRDVLRGEVVDDSIPRLAERRGHLRHA